MVEFKVSKDESYFFVKTTGDHPLFIGHSIKRPGKPSEHPKIFGGILEESQLSYRESVTQVQISKRCVPKFKEFIISKTGFMRIDPVIEEEYYVENCRDGEDSYHFKLEVTEFTHETEAITIYWINGTINHV